MMTLRSARAGEDHHSACRTTHQEPPMQDTFPPPDRGAYGQGSPDAWGNFLGKKLPHVMRLCFQNLDCISHLSDGDGTLKLHALLQFTTTFQVDIFVGQIKHMLGFTTSGSTPPFTHQRVVGNSHWSTSHNRNDASTSVYQPGGTVLVVTNELSHRALKPGDDPLGLGRWCWIKLCGTHLHHVQIVSMY